MTTITKGSAVQAAVALEQHTSGRTIKVGTPGKVIGVRDGEFLVKFAGHGWPRAVVASQVKAS